MRLRKKQKVLQCFAIAFHFTFYMKRIKLCNHLYCFFLCFLSVFLDGMAKDFYLCFIILLLATRLTNTAKMSLNILKKRLRKQSLISCYSEGMWAMACHVLIHGNQHSQYPKNIKRQLEDD